MKKQIFVVGFTLVFLMIVSNVYADPQTLTIERQFKKHMTLTELFSNKCTQCHEASRAQKIHDSGKVPMDVVKAMQKMKGAKISDADAIDIGKFLEAPFWLLPLFRGECTQCHTVDRIIEVCGKGPVSKETIKRMQLKGAKLTDAQVDQLLDSINKERRHRRHVALTDIFNKKCTRCHDAARAQKTHESVTGLVSTMQKKKGADISDEDAIDIVKFLEAPYWLMPLFRGECTGCHSLGKIAETCQKGPVSEVITKDTIKRMQLKGARITDAQVDEIYDILTK